MGRGFALAMAAVLVVWSIGSDALAQAEAGGAEDRPNVLLITADDLGLQLSSYGETAIETPHLDALAASGTRFEVAYVTQASCSPSRASMLTGTYPHTNGQLGLTGAGFAVHDVLAPVTLPALMRRAGYRTGIIGKLHVEPAGAFEFDFMETDYRLARRVRDVADVASAFIGGGGGGEEPWFLMVNYSDPHATRLEEAGAWYFERVIDGVPAHPIKVGEAPALAFQGVETPQQLARVANYYNCVLRLDEGVGMLMEVLEEAGGAEETLVIFVGDHGPPFARAKTTTYEAGLRVPFIVRWPGVGDPSESLAMVSTVDLFPTILDAAGMEIPEHVQGRSLRSVIADPAAPWRQYLGGEFHFHGARPFYPRRAIRDGRWKLIHNLRAGEVKPSVVIDGDQAYRLSRDERYGTPRIYQWAFDTFADPPEYELYDLAKDPHELQNLAGRPDHAQVEGRMRRALIRWRERTSDPLLDEAAMRRLIERAQAD